MALLAEAERVKAKKEKLDKKRKTVSKVIYFYIVKIFCSNFVLLVFIVFD
jgi:hypothetical protein